MAIVAASEGAQIRDSVRGLLSRLGDVRELRVLDVGGGLNPWLGNLVTDVLDIDARKGVVLHSGDINLASTWVNLGSKEFDFVNCTHTLEDIRDPGFVISQMNRVAKSGFVSVPNRHQENSPVESRNYLGYGHHRWIFHLRRNHYWKPVRNFQQHQAGNSDQKTLLTLSSGAAQLGWPDFWLSASPTTG